MTTLTPEQIAERLAAWKARQGPQAPASAPTQPSAPDRKPYAMLGPEVRRIRDALGLTQAELAKRLRVTVRMVKRYEREGIPHRARLRAETLRRMRGSRTTTTTESK